MAKVQIGQLWRGNFFGESNSLFLVLKEGLRTASLENRWIIWNLSTNKRVEEREGCFNDYYIWVADVGTNTRTDR